MKNLKLFLEEMPLREGANAIYFEPPFIAYVRVSDVHADDEGIRASVNLIPTPGMPDEGDPTFKIGAAWDVFSNSFGMWHAIYVNWSVYFGAEEVQAGLELAASAAAAGSKVELRPMRTALEALKKARMRTA